MEAYTYKQVKALGKVLKAEVQRVKALKGL
jgi:hypothetical protein